MPATPASSTACRGGGSRETADWLRERGVDARPYHAGLDAREREAAQDAFVRGEGVVIVATIAFGMGNRQA